MYGANLLKHTATRPCTHTQTLIAYYVGLQIIGEDGNPLTMKCANYFGCARTSADEAGFVRFVSQAAALHRFNNGQTMLDGLYAGSTALTMDYGEVLYRIQVSSHSAAGSCACLPLQLSASVALHFCCLSC